nr:CKLF-like MARVEL transmembrane domain-containing protein 3 isoform X4 [Chelonoidis abingdonii]
MYQEVGVWGRRDGTEGWGWGTNLGCLPAPRRRLSAAGQRRAEGGGARSGHSPHLQLLNFFTFPQCHDFRFPPLKKKNPSPQAFSSSPSRPVEPRSAPLPAMDLPASEDPDAQAPPPALRTLLPSRDFLCSRKGQLLLAESDFLRCVTAAIIYFAISIAAVSKYSDGASKAAGVFGFIATIVFAVDFYITFNDLVTFLKQGGSENATEAQKSEDEASDSDSD